MDSHFTFFMVSFETQFLMLIEDNLSFFFPLDADPFGVMDKKKTMAWSKSTKVYPYVFFLRILQL